MGILIILATVFAIQIIGLLIRWWVFWRWDKKEQEKLHEKPK